MKAILTGNHLYYKTQKATQTINHMFKLNIFPQI